MFTRNSFKENRTVLYGSRQSHIVLIQLVDGRELSGIEKEINLIKRLSGRNDFLFIAVKVEDWNTDLSPWKASAVLGDHDFAGGAEKTLAYLNYEVLPDLISDNSVSCLLGGYSLSGLFALWAATKTNRFHGIAAVSPSVWFPGFTEYLENTELNTQAVYQSLGDKEANTRNPVMTSVKDAILYTEDLLERKNIRSILEWNPGNHFKNPELRTAKGFAWLLEQL